ncbi:carbon-nitrogen hydrolase family protein [Rufibacter hautae]|uniref:Carbon-nitrogen hydrolase family protein n=1 Tax=Rufibacter hautae TaxID=2595005 RepID=A0A5B6TEY7_9BACT|nr:carbon-nitrogen hydrolase family protein [Rufibacter hautae]KAA3437820.1 carbon-nitrogen hydrolase family protein [Rufibacter hautae]
MKICVVQTKPIKGDIQGNIENHLTFISEALALGADTIIFPELSITGYEPELAEALATTPEDKRFDPFQDISNSAQVTIGIGVPIKSEAGTCISLVFFQPYQPRQTYSKKFLHADEEPFFVGGHNNISFLSQKPKVALAICYEVFVPQHAQDASRNGAEIYLASVAKSVKGMDKALERLTEVSKSYVMTIGLANCVGFSDNFTCGGKSSIWNNQGDLLGQLNGTEEGLLVFNTTTQELIERQYPDYAYQQTVSNPIK